MESLEAAVVWMHDFGPLRLKKIERHGRRLLMANERYAQAPDYDWWLVVRDENGVQQPMAKRAYRGKAPFLCSHGTAVAVTEILANRFNEDWYVIPAREWLAETTTAGR